MQLDGVKRFFAVAALALIAPAALAQFQAGMTLGQAEAQVKARLTNGATVQQIAKEALAANVDAGVLCSAMVDAGADPAGVVQAMISAGVPVQVVINAALASGASVDAVSQGATAAGVPASALQAAIASSPSAGTGPVGPAGTTTPAGSAGAGGGGGGGSSAGGSAVATSAASPS